MMLKAIRDLYNLIHLGNMENEFAKYYENVIPFGCSIITAFLVAMSMTLAINFVFGIGKFKQIKLSFLIAGVNLPYCNTPESYRNTDKVADNLFFFGQWNPNNCNCQQQCLKHLFTSSLESTTDRYSIKNGRNKARVRVYYQVRIILRTKIFIF